MILVNDINIVDNLYLTSFDYFKMITNGNHFDTQNEYLKYVLNCPFVTIQC